MLTFNELRANHFWCHSILASYHLVCCRRLRLLDSISVLDPCLSLAQYPRSPSAALLFLGRSILPSHLVLTVTFHSRCFGANVDSCSPSSLSRYRHSPPDHNSYLSLLSHTPDSLVLSDSQYWLCKDRRSERRSTYRAQNATRELFPLIDSVAHLVDRTSREAFHAELTSVRRFGLPPIFQTCSLRKTTFLLGTTWCPLYIERRRGFSLPRYFNPCDEVLRCQSACLQTYRRHEVASNTILFM